MTRPPGADDARSRGGRPIGITLPTVLASLLCGGSVLALSVSGATVLSGGYLGSNGAPLVEARGGSMAMDDTIVGPTRRPVLRPPSSVVVPAPAASVRLEPQPQPQPDTGTEAGTEVARGGEPAPARTADPAIAVTFEPAPEAAAGSRASAVTADRWAVTVRRTRPVPVSRPVPISRPAVDPAVIVERAPEPEPVPDADLVRVAADDAGADESPAAGEPCGDTPDHGDHHHHEGDHPDGDHHHEGHHHEGDHHHS